MKLKTLLLSGVLLIALTGCSSGEAVPSELEDRFRSVILIRNDASITGVRNYEISSGSISVSALGHRFEYFSRVPGVKFYGIWGMNNNGDIIFTFHDIEKNNSEIGAYNIHNDTYQILTESPEGLIADVCAFNDQYIICSYSNTDIDGMTNADRSEIHCLDTVTGEDVTVMTFDGMGWNTVGHFTFVGNILYFDQYGDTYSDILDTKVCKYAPGGEIEVVSEKARLVMPYNDTVAFIKNNSGIFTVSGDEDELLLEAELFGDASGINCSNDIFTYKYDIYRLDDDPNCATGNGVGFVNGNERVDLFEAADIALYFSEITFNRMGYGVWDSDPFEAVVPSFYDYNKNSFVIVDDTPMSYKCFSNDSSVLFVSINEQTQSAFYYLVT